MSEQHEQTEMEPEEGICPGCTAEAMVAMLTANREGMDEQLVDLIEEYFQPASYRGWRMAIEFVDLAAHMMDAHVPGEWTEKMGGVVYTLTGQDAA